MYLLQRRYDKASLMLDRLEGFAHQRVGSEQFSELISNDQRITAIWEHEEIEDVLVQLYESVGEYSRAGVVLTSRFHRIVSSGRPDAHALAMDVVERLDSYPNRGELAIDDLNVRLSRSQLQPEVLPNAPAQPVKVLVVGGNETQGQYDAMICEDYRERAPWLDVEFMHTGWSSNWSPFVDEFERRIDQVDAVVFIYLMRTELGRSLRKRCSKPWRGCGGKGRASIQRSIDAAAAAALSCQDPIDLS